RQLVGRDNELATIGEWWSKALNGRRQTGFIAAQAGVGKTYLAEAFVSELSAESKARVAWGQCVELYGGGEPYLPVLDALTELCHGPDGQRIWAVLQSQAPTWAVQLPGLGNPSDAERMQVQALGATSDRRLRELAQALETLTARSPLILVLEDLHNADSATVGLLSYLARRRQPASLLVLGTYRPVEAVARTHPLRQVVQDLRTRGLCEFLALELLSRG